MIGFDKDKKNFFVSLPVLPRFISRLFQLVSSHAIWFIWLVAVVLSIGSWIYFYSKGQTLAYNDARAHLNMARLAFDNLKPGFAQIGSVWLPLPHILELPTIQNDFLWKTGLSGSLVSMISYILSVIILYKFLFLSLKNKGVSLLGTLLYATNLNNLYVQSTPLTESLLMLFFVSSSYYLYRWYKSRSVLDLTLTALSVFFATLTRYDGWFLFITIAASLFFVLAKDELVASKPILENIQRIIKKFPHIQGKILLYATLASFGIILWILWNWAIYKDPFYFAYGEYSARSQQTRIEEAGSLFSKHNIALSLLAYFWAMVDNVGLVLFIFSAIGLISYLISKRFSSETFIIATLLTPVVFHMVSLYLGHSFLVVPELSYVIREKAGAYWFNVRYGLMALPAVAFFSAYLAKKDKFAQYLLIAIIVFETFVFGHFNKIATLEDGLIGTSSFQANDISNWLKENANNGNELILTSMINNSVAFTTGFPLKRFIHEGTGLYWENSLANPSKYATWILVSNTDKGDPVYDALFKEREGEFLRNFDLAARFDFSDVYKRRDHPRDFVYTKGTEIRVNDEQFKFIGFNSYDLVYRTDEEIDATFKLAADSGAKVIRFWVFGEGNPDGIQPEKGIYSEERLKRIDKIIDTAYTYNIKVIPVLSDYWPSYGGVGKYLEWVGLPHETPTDLDAFYSNPQTKKLYKDFVKTIVDRTNETSKIRYQDDPVIFGWELMNEPRSSGGPANLKVISWMSEMNDYIKGFDPNHIVLSGSEGSLLGSQITAANSTPYFEELAGLDFLPILTAHYYIGDSKIITTNYNHPVVATWKWKANLYTKPIIIEEVGFSKNSKDTNGIARIAIYRNLLNEAKINNIDGILLWNWALKEDDNYGISPLDSDDAELLQLIKNYSREL